MNDFRDYLCAVAVLSTLSALIAFGVNGCSEEGNRLNLSYAQCARDEGIFTVEKAYKSQRTRGRSSHRNSQRFAIIASGCDL